MATAAGPSSNLLDLVRCELCLETYNDSDRLPKLLHCSHTFCLTCVQRYYESKLKNRLSCPNCRRDFIVPEGGVRNLNTNIMVVNLLDHLAPFTAVDTDKDIAEFAVVPKDKIPEEPGPVICAVHPGEKCDFYCDDCRDPLCADCILSVSEGPHRTHKIRKLRDVLTTYSTQHKDALQLVANMKMEGNQRVEELLEELILSRDSLMNEAKSKRDTAHQEADKWYQNTIDTISKVYLKVHNQILQFKSKINLQELQQSLENIDFQKINGDLEQAQSFLDQLQSSVTSLKTSNGWPPEVWSVDVGTINDDFTVDLGSVTEPTIKLPDVNRFPYTMEKIHENTEGKPNVSKQKQTQKQPEFRQLSDLSIQRGCDRNVGLTTNDAVVYFNDQLCKITFNGDILKQSALPLNISESCHKYILNDNTFLLRENGEGPSFKFNSQLELVSTIQEDYGCIIGAESIEWVAFYKDRNIRIYDLEHKQLLQKLTPPARVRWGKNLSICRHPDSHILAVVDHNDESLCIYDHDGRHRTTHNLNFNPRSEYAISCNRRHLYVASWDPVSVFVFLWSGQLVTRLDEDQLMIPKGHKISNIAVGEDQFSIAVGIGVVRSFKTFQCV